MPKATFGKAMFNQMMGACPSAARLFDPPADPAAAARHQRYFVELVQRASSSIMEPERALGQWLEMVGQGHAQFKVSPAHWDCLGEALTDAICQWLPPGRHRRETVHAWRVLVSFISDRLGECREIIFEFVKKQTRGPLLVLGLSTQMPTGHGQNACPIHHPRIELLRLVTDGHPEQSS
uniref:Globin family profile domain-containing protein n=1 Tax=Globodera rostochiensis TaxID=31243 RepID=A0A914GYW6_GLORO